MVIYCKLIAKEYDLNYINLVFKNLDPAPFGYNYTMCTVYPNWESYIPVIGDIGYLDYLECRAGEDKWWNRETQSFIPYNYTNIQFMKFVKETKDNSDKNIIL